MMIKKMKFHVETKYKENEVKLGLKRMLMDQQIKFDMKKNH